MSERPAAVRSSPSGPAPWLKDSLWTSLLITTGLFILGSLTLVPYFQTNDDVMMQLLVKGLAVTGEPSASLNVMSPLAGGALVWLYRHGPTLPWYGLWIYAVFFATQWGIWRFVLEGPHQVFRSTALLLVSPILFFYPFARVQFTVVAGCAVMVGILLISAGEGVGGAGRRLHAGTLILLGFLVRSQECFLILGVVPILACLPSVRSAWKRIPPYYWMGLGGLILLAAFGGPVQNGPESAIANTIYAQLTLHKAVRFDGETAGIFKGVGWSENDWNTYRAWYYSDPVVHRLDKLEELNRRLPWNWRVKVGVATGVFGNLSLQFLLAGSILALLGIPRKVWPQVLLVGLWLVLLMMGASFIFKGSERVHLPWMAGLSLWAIGHLDPREGFWPSLGRGWIRWAWVPVVPFLMFGTVVLTRVHQLNSHFIQYESNLQGSLDRLHPQPNQLYVVWGSAFPFENLRVFGGDRVLAGMNLACLNWIQRFESTQRQLARFGIHDVFRDIVDRKDVFLVLINEWPLYETYLREHDGLKVGYRVMQADDQLTVVAVERRR